jgi:hypothetical protein
VERRTCCDTCEGPLQGRQRRFCSRRCKNADTNHRNQRYACQQERGLRRKLELLELCGKRCTRCGYDKNMAALTWHHPDPAAKKFQLDLRSLSNRSEREIMAELAKCVLLCANCHAETHSPLLDLRLLGKSGLASRFDLQSVDAAERPGGTA